MLHSLCLADRDGNLLLSHYFVDTTIEFQDEWEVAIAAVARPFLRDIGLSVFCTTAAGRPIMMRGIQDVIFILCGTQGTDEMQLIEILDFIVTLVNATCENAMSPPHVLALHGKIAVCMNEAFYGGRLLHSDVETVLRNAKLKAPVV